MGLKKVSNRSKSPKRVAPKKHSRWRRIGRFGLFALALVVVFIAGTLAYSYQQRHGAANAAQLQQKNYHKQHKPDQQFDKGLKENGHYNYNGENSGIPNAKQLQTYLQDNSATITTWGHAGTYAQPGLSIGIQPLPVMEGVSNAVLARGWGSTKPGYTMGENDNILAAHNFADGHTYASPLQYIDVSKRPTFYQWDSHNLYTYRLTKRKVVNKQSLEFDSLVAPTGTKRLVLYTCDEPTMVANLNPAGRVAVSGEYVSTTPLKDAPSAVKELLK